MNKTKDDVDQKVAEGLRALGLESVLPGDPLPSLPSLPQLSDPAREPSAPRFGISISNASR